MLHSVNSLRGFHVRATDGDIGSVREVYFDDEDWAVRYLIVDTGGWLSGRKVLISPYSVSSLDWNDTAVVVRLTREQVERSPDIDTDRPVSRQHETEYNKYYGYPAYWPYTSMWAWGAMPVTVPDDPAMRGKVYEDKKAQIQEGKQVDTHLRSSREVAGYSIQASDGPIGHVEDFLFEDDSWGIRYLVVDTRNWLPGRRVLVSPQWIRGVSWPDRSVSVDLTREQIENGPEYDPSQPLSRGDEAKIHSHYDRPGYWM
jgi:hypothetical protein